MIDRDDGDVDDVIGDPAMATDDCCDHWSDWCLCERPCRCQVLESKETDERTHNRTGEGN